MQSDADIIKPIQIVNEATRKARHAIRKALEASRDYAKATGNLNVIESQSFELQSFTTHMAERAEKGFDRL